MADAEALALADAEAFALAAAVVVVGAPVVFGAAVVVTAALVVVGAVVVVAAAFVATSQPSMKHVRCLCDAVSSNVPCATETHTAELQARAGMCFCNKGLLVGAAVVVAAAFVATQQPRN